MVQEERVISHSYQEKIKDLISNIDTLKKEGRHFEASCCQSQVEHSFCGQNHSSVLHCDHVLRSSLYLQIYQLKKAERQEREKAGERIMKKV